MRKLVFFVAVLVISAIQVSSQTAAKPSFNGTWVLQGAGAPQVYTYEHDETRWHMVQRIDDPGDKRVIDVSCPIDGQPHHLTVDGDNFTMTVQWFGDSLIYETRRERSIGIRHNLRVMTLAGHDEIRALRTRFLPGPEESWQEIWLRKSEK